MRVKLAFGNSKMGKVTHVNLPPPLACDIRMPCFKGGCYAMKAYRQYKESRAAWDHNWKMVMTDRDNYFRQIEKHVLRKQPDLFRWHSAGDIPDSDYLARVRNLAHRCESTETQFTLFTKKYDLLKVRAPRTPNLTIIASAWPGLDMPNWLWTDYPIAYMRDPDYLDPRIPDSAILCSGKCDTCGLCWGLGPGQAVVFNKH